MTSIYERALGDSFAHLHPKIQARFGFSSADGVAHIGTGVMDTMTRGRSITVPFLKFGATRHLLFPEYGTNIAFTIGNYAYVDRFGRETVTWHRTFDFVLRRRWFDATMIYSDTRATIVDYLGTHQHVAADLRCWADGKGGINFASGEQRCHEGLLNFRFPRAVTGHATVREWFDDDIDRHRIEVAVANPLVGPVISYRGTFTDDIVAITDPTAVTVAARPTRETERA
ncbi:DUF4166 domain-containing protein [soil metagenome]